MPTLTATPMALPQGTEQEVDQDFELDIRVLMPNVAHPQSHQVSAPGTCGCSDGSCGGTCDDNTCAGSCGATCTCCCSCRGTCDSCSSCWPFC